MNSNRGITVTTDMDQTHSCNTAALTVDRQFTHINRERGRHINMRGMQGPMLITEQKNNKYTNLKRMNQKFRTNNKHTKTQRTEETHRKE